MGDYADDAIERDYNDYLDRMIPDPNPEPDDNSDEEPDDGEELELPFEY